MTAATDLPFAAPGMEIVDTEPDTLAEEVWDYAGTEGLTEDEQREQAEIQEQVAQSLANAAVVAGATLPPGAATAAPAGAQAASSPFPKFEGLEVKETTVKLNGEGKVESLAGLVVSMHDRVRLVGEFTVVAVNHKINKDGEAVREMVFKASLLELAPWDPADPTDDGILRARPVAP